MGEDYKVTAEFDGSARFPVGTELSVQEIRRDVKEEADAYQAYFDTALEEVQKTQGKQKVFTYARFFDISFVKDGFSYEPAAPVSVTISYDEMEEEDARRPEEDADVSILHFDDKKPEEILAIEPEVTEEEETLDIAFDAEQFSVYGVVYTVDFHYEVNGKMYEFSIPGGGFVSLEHLVEVLGVNNSTAHTENASENAENGAENGVYNAGEESDIANTTTYSAANLNALEISEETKKFVADVESVEFSSPELVWVGKVDSDSTVGGLKEANGLECEYSADLTDAQIAEINAQKVESGDWAFISVKPFDTVETLTVTMKNGDRFQITVTDAQLSADVLTAAGETYRITVTYDDEAQIPDGTKLVVKEIEPGTDAYIQYLGRVWTEENHRHTQNDVDNSDKNGSAEDSEDELPVGSGYININSARFFDITLMYRGEEIEPKTPVQVEITYVEGLAASENTSAGVVHYISEDNLDLIEGVETTVQDDAVTGFRYEQNSFSVVGTYISQETQDYYEEPKLAAAPDPSGKASSGDLNLRGEALDSLVRASLSTNDLLRAAETEQSYTEDNSKLEKPVAHKSLKPNKDENNQNDGTYTLTLSVKGHSSLSSETIAKKANVLFVMDRSSSMITKTVSDDEVFWYYGTWDTSEYTFRGDINPSSGYQFYGIIDGEYVPLNVSSTWSSWYGYNLTYQSGTDFWGNPIYTNYPSGNPLYVKSKKTRMVAEQEALSSLFGQLMEKNDASGANKDVIEISVISFGDERFDDKTWSSETEVGWTSGRNTAPLMNGVLSNRYTSGTNWEEALEYAHDVISAKKAIDGEDEDYHVIFLTDGEPTAVHGNLPGQVPYQNNNIGAYDAAKDDAEKLVSEDKVEFYNIFTYRKSEDQTYSIYLTNYAYGNGDYNANNTDAVQKYYSDARTVDALNDAFNDIFSIIENSIGHGNVSITDTLTKDAMTTTVVQGKTNGYVYEVKDGDGTVLYIVTATGDIDNPTVTFNVPGSATETYTATSSVVGGKTVYSIRTDENKVYKMALADVDDETGELAWDLSPVGLLMDDCTYSVSFVVWPDQDAYDYVAALNNGLTSVVNSRNETVEVKWDKNASTYEDLTETKGYEKGGVEKYPSIVRYADGTFAVLTNTDQKLHYSVVETNNGETTITGPFYQDLETPDPMPLTATSSQIEKQWNVERDPGILAQLLYDHEGKPTKYKIEFDILKDDDGTTSEDDAANTYTTVKLGWSDEENKYLWEADSVRNVTYSGHSCQVGTRWATDFSIATGLMLSEERMDAIGLDKTAYPSGEYDGVTYYVLEEGHDYTIKEPGLTYEFDFNGPTYHPMLVDGVLRSVNLTIDEDAGTVDISNMTSAEVRLSSLKIENTLRGYINLDKVVVGSDGVTPEQEDDTKFEYTVVLENDTDPGPFTVEGSHVPWYGISGLYYHTIEIDGDEETFHYFQAVPQGVGKVKLTDEDGNEYIASCEGTFAEDVGPETITYTDGSGTQKTIQLYGNQMERRDDHYVSATIQIEQGQTLNIANVPVGTKYTITENSESGYDLVKIEREIKVSPESDAESSDTVTGTSTIKGTIVGNRDNHIIYTNKTTTTLIGVEKVWDTPAGLSSGTADVILYKVVGKKADDLGEGEIDPAKPSQKIRVTVDASLISETTGEPSGVSKFAYIDIAYTGTGTGSYRLSNENGWKHTFEFDRGGTYDFTYTPDGTRVKSVSPEESEGIDTTTTIPLTAIVEDIPQYTYTFTVPAAERQDRGGIVVTCNGEEKTANADNNWTVTFPAANEASVTYSAAPTNGFITAVTLDPAAAAGEEATADKTVQMHPTYAATTLTVPVTVNWTGTPPTGTTVTVSFIPDKEGVSTQTLTLNGGESWTSSKTLDRLDENGDLITWTVTTGTEAPSSHTVSVSLQSPAGATIRGTVEDVAVNGTSAVATMVVPISVNWGTDTPDSGTTVTVTFTNGTTMETVTLDGSESTAWTTSKILPRLDASGNTLTWSVSTEVSSPGNSASVTGAPASVSDPDGDGTADSVTLTGTVDKKMNLTVKTSGSVNIGGFYKATIVGGTVYLQSSDKAGELSGWGEQNKTFAGLDIKDDSDADQYYAIVLWDESSSSRTDVKTDLTTVGYTISALEDYFTTRTVIYFKAEAGDKTLELTKSNTTTGQILTGQTMDSVNPTASVYAASGRTLLKAGGGKRLLGAANTGSPVQTFYDTAIEEESPAFTVVQFKDLPAGAVPVEKDGDGNNGTQTLTGNETYEWSKLPTTDENGNPIYYYVVEKSATAQADSMSVKYEYEYNADGTIKTVKITNTTTGTPTPTTGDITVTKSFSGVNALPDGFKITNDYDDQEFTVANATGTNPYTWKLTGIPDGTTVTFTESGTTFNGYNLEVKANGTIVADSSVSASVVAGETVTASLVNTYTPKTVTVTLKKVDKSKLTTVTDLSKLEASDLLDGAKFILEKYNKLSPQEEKDSEWCDAHSDLNSGEDGVFTFSDLPVGIYKIIEKERPAGYVTTTSVPAFEVVVDDTTGDLRINLLNDAGGLVRLVDGELTIVVGNEPGAALPNTGGPGTNLIYLIGLMLTVFAGAGLVMKKRRKAA